MVRNHDEYFLQRVKVSQDLVGKDRVQTLISFCRDQRVLHLGCADWPITDPKRNLHVQLDSTCAALDGFDVNTEAFAQLRPLVRGRLFNEWAQVSDSYDLILAPEVLEHVDDFKGFLGQMSAVDAPRALISVPDAYQCFARHFHYAPDGETFFEAVHPDHNCWFTPYTLQNTIQKYSKFKVEKMWFFNGISLLAILSRA